MPQVRVSLIVRMKLNADGLKANWDIVIDLCPLNCECFLFCIYFYSIQEKLCVLLSFTWHIEVSK